MKIDIKYTGNIINLPVACADFAEKATKEDFVVILNLLKYNNYLAEFENYIAEFASKINMSIESVKASIEFWTKANVLNVDSFEELTENMVTDTKSNTVPTYTGAQIASFIEKNKDTETLFSSCRAILGKDFTSHDYNNIIFLKSYYNFDDDFIMLLIAHCVEVEKVSWAYIRKTAKNLYDMGINTYKKLEIHFEDRKNQNSLEYKIRKLFGIGEREFSKTEKDIIFKWISFDINIDLIKKAYDITVDKTGKASLRYAAKILENWISSGISTPEQADDASKSFNGQNSSFDTDEFFEAALKRSYGDLYKGGDKK